MAKAVVPVAEEVYGLMAQVDPQTVPTAEAICPTTSSRTLLDSKVDSMVDSKVDSMVDSQVDSKVGSKVVTTPNNPDPVVTQKASEPMSLGSVRMATTLMAMTDGNRISATMATSRISPMATMRLNTLEITSTTILRTGDGTVLTTRPLVTSTTAPGTTTKIRR